MDTLKTHWFLKIILINITGNNLHWIDSEGEFAGNIRKPLFYYPDIWGVSNEQKHLNNQFQDQSAAEEGSSFTPELGTSWPILTFSSCQYSRKKKQRFQGAKHLSPCRLPVWCVPGVYLEVYFKDFPSIPRRLPGFSWIFQLIFPPSWIMDPNTKMRCPARCPTSELPLWQRCSH